MKQTKLKNKLASVSILFRYILFKKRVPLAVRINLTNKCINKCSYCNVWNTPSKEMSTAQVFSLIDQLKIRGTQTISFSGGEPLLKKDIGKLVSYCKKQGMSTNINTSGSMFDQKVKDLKDLDLLQISLDGKKEVNDLVRGKGSFDLAKKTADIAKENNINFCFDTTLTRKNTDIENVTYMINLARGYKTSVIFQPYKEMIKGVKDIEIGPTKSQIREVVDFLIQKKREKSHKGTIRNSSRLLKQMEYIGSCKCDGETGCVAGKLFMVVDPNGDLMACDRSDIAFSKKLPNILKVGVKKAFRDVPKVKCSGCGFSGAWELTYLSKLYLDVFLEIKKFI